MQRKKMEGAARHVKGYELVCKAIDNDCSKYCSIIVAIQSILTMEVARRAFMSLPYPESSDYVIPDSSITALIHSFFLKRHRPRISGEDVADAVDQCSDKLGRIAKWLQRATALISSTLQAKTMKRKWTTKKTKGNMINIDQEKKSTNK